VKTSSEQFIIALMLASSFTTIRFWNVETEFSNYMGYTLALHCIIYLLLLICKSLEIYVDGEQAKAKGENDE
jgi:hypothetical protein